MVYSIAKFTNSYIFMVMEHMMGRPQKTFENQDSEDLKSYTYRKLKDIVDTHDIETNFEISEMSPEAQIRVETGFETMLANKKTFLGAGNNALVYNALDSENNELCVKCIWDSVGVGLKSKKFEKLPAAVQALRKVEEYFEIIKRRKQMFEVRGASFMPQNSATVEAILTNFAKSILAKNNMPQNVPKVDFVIQRDVEKSGEIPSGNGKNEPYMTFESMHMVYMEVVAGRTIEDIILSSAEAERGHLNIERIETKLRAMLDAFHSEYLYHRDISTRNILIDPNGDPWIIDFGTAEVSQAHPEDSAQNDNDQLKSVLNDFRKFVENPEIGRDEYMRKVGS
jgi:serine/threonine protein kinase